jgi:hypothetical protein
MVYTSFTLISTVLQKFYDFINYAFINANGQEEDRVYSP